MKIKFNQIAHKDLQFRTPKIIYCVKLKWKIFGPEILPKNTFLNSIL